MDFSFLYAALKRGVSLIAQGFVLLGQSLLSAMKWANAPNQTDSAEKIKVDQHYQQLVDRLNITVVNQSLELQRHSEKTRDLEQRMDAKDEQIETLEKKVEECQEDREAQGKQIQALNLLSGTQSQETHKGGKE